MHNLFVNPHSRSLDAKGRLQLPTDYRDALQAAAGDGAVRFWLTAFYGHLTAYLPEDWAHITEQLNRIPFSSVKLSHFKTKVLGLAQQVEPDAQGRIRITQPLMREAGLSRDVMLVGMDNKFEIWDQQRFDALQVEDVSAELASSGLEIPL